MSTKTYTFLFRTLLVGGTIFAGIWIGQLLSPFTRVVGNSMFPTIVEGDIFRVDHTVPRHIPRGTIVVIRQYPSPPLIKRVVGLPHENVSFRLGEVFVNGKMLYEPYLPEAQTTFAWQHETISPGDYEYVVLGDNRLISQDSREYGVVPRSQIIGVLDLSCPQVRFLAQPRYRILASSSDPEGVIRKGTQSSLVRAGL